VNLAPSLASAALLILVFPRFNLTWLAPVALTPILIACAREQSWKRRFLQGWAAGFVFWFGVCYWIQFVLQDHGGLGVPLSWVSFLLFAILKGLHLALFSTAAGFLMRKPRALPAVAALWTGLERTHGTFGFAWLDLGNAGVDMPILMRAAPWVGVYGLSFVLAMFGCAVALIVLRSRRRELVRELIWLAALAILPMLPALPPPAQGTEAVRVVQPNVDTEAEFTSASLADLSEQMETLSRAPGVPLIVWPEWPAPFDLTPSYRAYIAGVTRESQASLIFNGVARSAQGEPLNSAFLVNPEGGIVDRYDQITLVPFGEYVPAPFGWVNRITKETSDFAPGNRVVVFPDGGHKLGVFICYEAAFPDLVRQFPRDGAEVLFNLSNDGYFAHSAAREQHLRLARMRAAENRRWVLFATNDGITAMIDPSGRITDRLPPYRQLAADMQYQYVAQTTFYTRHGDWFAWGCLLAGLAGLLQRRHPALV
jgi:apolipoprotein N-acyltransferase